MNAPLKVCQDKILADSRARDAAVESLNSFKVNGTLPFSTTATDLWHSAAEEAHALAIVLAVAIDELVEDGSEEIPLRPRHIAKAIDAIGTLIALSIMAGEAAESEARAA